MCGHCVLTQAVLWLRLLRPLHLAPRRNRSVHPVRPELPPVHLLCPVILVRRNCVPATSSPPIIWHMSPLRPDPYVRFISLGARDDALTRLDAQELLAISGRRPTSPRSATPERINEPEYSILTVPLR